jgi:hypothetical protein
MRRECGSVRGSEWSARVRTFAIPGTTSCGFQQLGAVGSIRHRRQDSGPRVISVSDCSGAHLNRPPRRTIGPHGANVDEDRSPGLLQISPSPIRRRTWPWVVPGPPSRNGPAGSKPRRLRIAYEGAIHRLMARGDVRNLSPGLYESLRHILCDSSAIKCLAGVSLFAFFPFSVPAHCAYWSVVVELPFANPTPSPKPTPMEAEFAPFGPLPITTVKPGPT